MTPRTDAGPSSTPPHQSGAAAIWSIGLLLLLLFAGALAADLWSVLARHGTLTAIADAAAVAGATEVVVDDLYRNQVVIDPRTASEAARQFAQGQPEWGASSTVSVIADPAQVVVQVTEPVPLSLMRIFVPRGSITLTVTSRASPREFG